MEIKDCVLLVVATALACFMLGMIFGCAQSKGYYQKFCPECGAHYTDKYSYCNFDEHELLSNAR